MSPTPVRKIYLYHFSFQNRTTFLLNTQIMNVLRICNQSVDISLFFSFLPFISSSQTADIKMTLSSYQLMELHSSQSKNLVVVRFRSYHCWRDQPHHKNRGYRVPTDDNIFFRFPLRGFLIFSLLYTILFPPTFWIHSGWLHSPIRPCSQAIQENHNRLFNFQNKQLHLYAN